MFTSSLRLRSALADTVAMVIYCFVTGMAIEILISGMSFQQSLSSRLLSIPVNMVIAWPYGVYRDRIVGFAHNLAPRSCRSKNVADLIAYVSFQSPVYMAILLSIGANASQIATAVGSNAVISMVMGVVYGYFLEYCRQLFRVSSKSQERLVTH